MNNLIGHIEQQKKIRQTVAMRQLSHAYILHGPQGIGKKLFAINLGKGLLCESKRMFQSCDCASCKQITERNHPDFYLFDDKEGLSIENVRNVSEISGMATYSGGYKVVIFDNIHIMCQAGGAAANALLKTLEEPGENTIFLLITHKLDRVLTTIQSRSVKINFAPLKDTELRQILAGMDMGQISPAIIPLAGGSVTNALILASLPTEDLLNALARRNMGAVGAITLGLTDKEQFAAVLGVIRGWFLTQYKTDLAPKRAFFIQYIDKTLKNLEYNVNIPIVLLDFFTKLEEANI